MSFYVTTPIYYVNDVPHIGHAYTSLAADTLARWHRLMGEDTYCLTGTDEHGLKIEQAARKTGITPKAHADRYAQPFRDLLPCLDLTFDDFIRTTEPRHQAVVAEIWKRMEAAGDIYLGKYEGWYSVGDEAYFTEEELVNGKSPSGHDVAWVVEPSYFFRMSKYGPALLEHLKAHPDFIQPTSRYNEILRFVESGLNDISVSRTTFSWGIPVPDAPGHVVYVWVDALTNYISALGGPGAEKYERFWSESVHLIGKDILRFHAVYWPCFLMSAGLPCPKRIFAHGWWTHDGEKMSKTRGNTVDPVKMAAEYGPDAFRYFLLREVSFGTDGDFSVKALENRINGDLANDYGNLLNRTVGMVARYRQSVIPSRGTAGELDAPLLAAFDKARADLVSAMDSFAFHQALAAIWTLVAAGNKYVDACAPWVLSRAGDEARLNEVLYTLCETLRVVGVWTLPFLPRKATALLDRLGVPEDLRTFASTLSFGALASGGTIAEGEPLFPRLDRPEADKTAEKPAKAPKAEKPAKAPKAEKPKETKETPVSEQPAAVAPIAYDDFAKLDLRVARVLTAQKHPDADRLLVVTLDAGEAEPRTVCAGIAAHYAPEELVGRLVVLLANLAPRKIRGIQSNGMLLAGGDGEVVRLLAASDDLKPGAKVS